MRELPHPYTSHAQFERQMEAPLGSEWNTRVGFQRGTLPRVVKKVRKRCLWGPGVALLSESHDVVLVIVTGPCSGGLALTDCFYQMGIVIDPLEKLF